MLRRYLVKGHSMEPNFSEGDRLLLNSFFYSVKVGDVVVFSDGTRDYLKRVIKSNGGNYVVEGDNNGHSGQFTITREQVKGKFLMKY